MSSTNDYYQALQGYNIPMFSQGNAGGADPMGLNSFVTEPVLSPMAAYQIPKIGMPTLGDGTGSGLLDGFKQWSKDWIGSTEAPGPLGFGMGAAQGIFGGYLGMQQLKAGKQKLAESKRQFDLQYEAQKGLTNSQLEDRQRARLSANPGAYQSVGDYMNKYGVK